MTGAPDRTELLLMSGGVDSAALAALRRPALALTVVYGQRPAEAEVRASEAVCAALGVRHEMITVGWGSLGSGLLASDDPSPDEAPSPEWWPYRNQLLLTAGAAVALRANLEAVVFGTVAGDGGRHRDGTAEFMDLADQLLSYQEGGVRVLAPAVALTTIELVRKAGVGIDLLGWTHSCHRANLPCAACPGCFKRRSVIDAVLAAQRP